MASGTSGEEPDVEGASSEKAESHTAYEVEGCWCDEEGDAGAPSANDEVTEGVREGEIEDEGGSSTSPIIGKDGPTGPRNCWE